MWDAHVVTLSLTSVGLVRTDTAVGSGQRGSEGWDNRSPATAGTSPCL